MTVAQAGSYIGPANIAEYVQIIDAGSAHVDAVVKLAGEGSSVKGHQ
jgi:hypothetical protein